MIRKPQFVTAQRGGQTNRPHTFPAPVGGWNTRDSEAAMPARKALVLNNWFPKASYVETRPGCETWATGLPSSVRTILAYTGVASEKLFAACNSGVYDITAGGAVGAVAKTLTDGRLSHTMFTALGGSYLFAVNGLDDMIRYDGTTWTSVNAASSPAITGKATNLLTFIHPFKRRLWFIEKNSLSIWYLPVGQIGGALTEFPVGQIFKEGGRLVALATWTLDGGSGMDDHLVMVTSKGELAVYKGTDPSSSTDWALVGVYALGEPMGDRCFVKYGGDLLYLSKRGFFPLSKALLATTINYNSALSDEIGPTFSDVVTQYGALEGWQPVVFPQYSCVFVNVPLSVDRRYDQFVMNSTNQSWCRFTGWNALCWGLYGQDAYFGYGTAIAKAFRGYADFGAVITADVKTAPSTLGARSREKHLTALRPLYRTDGAVGLSIAAVADFDVNVAYSSANPPAQSTALWGAATWDVDAWGFDATLTKEWRSVETSPGFYFSILMRAISKTARTTWIATDALYNPGGAL